MTTRQAPYEVSVEKTHSTVTIRPELTQAEWSEIERAGDDILTKINGPKPRGVMVDLTPLEHMGSSMVAMIVRCWKATQPQKQGFVVVSNNEVVREVLQLSGLAKMWAIVSTPEDGLKSLGVSRGGSGAAKWLLILSVVALVVAVAGLGVWFGMEGRRNLATGLIYGGALGGFVLGLAVMMLAAGKQRLIGLGVVVLSVAAGVIRLVQ